MNLIEHRVGENGLLPFRTQRIFNIGEQWYFAVRDGADCGPFANQEEAITGLYEFLNEFKAQSHH